MIKIKLKDATDVQLDWLVAKCLGAMRTFPHLNEADAFLKEQALNPRYCFTRYWEQCGRLISTYKIDLYHHQGLCAAARWEDFPGGGKCSGKVIECKDELQAITRCLVQSIAGDDVEVPEGLS